MPRNGSGDYSLPAGNPVSTGTTISSTWANNTLSDVGTALTQSVSKDGQTAYTGNQPMGGNRHTNVGNATARNEYATLGQVQDSAGQLVTSVSGTNTITGSVTGLSSYASGQTFRFTAVNAITGASTLNLNGLGAISITKQGAVPLVTGDIVAGQVVQVTYDGTQFQMVNPNGTVDSSFSIIDNSDTTKVVRFGIGSLTSFPTATTAVLDPPGYNAQLANVPVGSVMDYAGSVAPTGWLICNGAAVSRATYSVLFALVGTTYGAGDGSTTFNIPDLRGRTSIGAGSAVFAETVTSSSANGFVVANNVDAWLTGMPVVLSSLSGFTTTATAGPTYFVVRISATNIRLATTLALAQNETPDITISGSGSCVVTYTATSRALGSRGGQTDKAMTINELLSHNHPMSNSGAGSSGGNFAVDYSSSTILTGPRGGNAAMPIMNPYMALTKIIRAL